MGFDSVFKGLTMFIPFWTYHPVHVGSSEPNM